MTRLRLTVSVGVLALGMVAGALAWSVWFRSSDGESLADRCQGMLAVDEAREFFGGAELRARGGTGEWGGHDTQWCSVRAEGQSDGPVLRLRIRPRAAYRSSGAAEEAGATPVGYGWTGSYDHGYEPQAAVLVDCEPMAGHGLVVLTGTNRRTRELTATQTAQVARLATESARAAAKHFGCEGPLGQRPAKVDTTEWEQRPVARATGTCEGAVDGPTAARLRITTVSEKPAGRALTEQCSLARGDLGLLHMTAYYGPSAEQETYLDGRYPGTVKGMYMRSLECGGGIGTAYFKLVRTQDRDANGEFGAHGPTDSEALHAVLAAFASASGERHGCPEA